MASNEIKIKVDATEAIRAVREILRQHGFEQIEDAPAELLAALRESELRIIPDWMRVL